MNTPKDCWPASRASTAYQSDQPTLEMKRFWPFSRQPSCTRSAWVRMLRRSEPPPGSVRQKLAPACPAATRGTTCCCKPSDPNHTSGVRAAHGMNITNEEEPQTRATSSTANTCDIRSPSPPPRRSGNGNPFRPMSRNASMDATGNRASSSTEKACGLIRCSASRRSWDRKASSSGVGVVTGPPELRRP